MKICLINQLYEPYLKGGAGVVVKNIITGLRQAGHEVVLITIKPFKGFNSFNVEVEELEHLKIYRFCPLNIFSFINIDKKSAWLRLIWHFFDIYNWHSAKVVKKILKREKPQVVMTHNLKGIGYQIPRVIKKLGIKHVHTVHDVQLSVPTGLIIKGQEKHWHQTGFLTKRYQAICRKLFNSADIIISPSRFLLNYYKERGFFSHSKKFVLPNPVVLAEFPVPKKDFNRTGFKFLFVGQLEWHKGLLFLVDVFRSLDKEYFTKGVLLNIIGRGKMLGRLKEMIRGVPQIILRGLMPRKEIARVFQEADILIVPSLCYENSPAVIYEAWAAGIPVIAARIGGVAELIEEGKNGFTFEAGDRDDLTRVLKYVLENRDMVHKMRKNCLESASEHSADKYVDELLGYVRLA